MSKPHRSEDEQASRALTKEDAESALVSDNSAAQTRDDLVAIVGQDGLWWWRVLIRARTYEGLLPWPLDFCIRVSLGRLSTRLREVEGSGWTTLSILVGMFLVKYLGKNPTRDAQLALEVAKFLLSGSFLIGTILSVSVALPGQALIKLVLKDDPEYALDFVVPFMWAFMWGVLGAASLLTFYSNYVLEWARPIAVFVASYGAGMLLHAITHAMRKYLLGLLMKSADDDG